MNRTNPFRIERGPLGKAGALTLTLLGLGGLSCGDLGGGGDAETTLRTGAALAATCSGTPVKVVDMHADFRDIWKGTEAPETGKETGVRPTVGLDFDTTVQPSLVTAQFVPLTTDGSCGPTVPTVLTSSVLAPQVWGTVTSDVARAPVPAPFNVLVKDSITGIVSAGGPVAAGGDIALSGVTVNGTARQPVGLIAGGKVSLINGSIVGDVTYGVASTIPGSISVTGTKSLKPFSASAAFQDLASLSVLLAQETANGTAKVTNGSLQLTGTKTTLNVFQISADMLAQATSLQISVPANSGTLVNVTGNMTVAFQNKGVTLSGATAATLLWNVPAAPFVQISGIALSGSLLAPRALVTFDSGSFAGTLVAAGFASSGSGTLTQAPLNTTKVFGTNAPSAVRLTPAQDLVRGCAYHFVIPGTTPFTTGGACLSPAISIPFRAALSAAPPSGRELTNVEPDPVLHTLRRFTARAGVNTPVDDVWARYESAIGIAVSNLVPTTATAPSSTRPGQTVTVYQQYAQGYPVAGYGYFVAAQGGQFRAANGKVMPGLPAFPAPTVTASTALSKVLTAAKITQAPWVKSPTLYKAPVGRLVVMAKRSYPRVAGDFALAWDFRFGTGTGLFEPAGAKVDAATGTVLALESGLQAVTPLNGSATYTVPKSGTVDTVYDGLQSFLVGSQPFVVAGYKNPDLSQVEALASGDVKSASVLATVTGATEDATLSIVGTPQFIVHPAGTPWTATDLTERRMASLQWGLELANSFLGTLNLQIAGNKWVNIDGPAARQKVLINYNSALPSGVPSPIHYSAVSSTPDTAQIFVYDSPTAHGFGGNVAAHEYTHALVDSLRRAAGLGSATGATMAGYKEAGSLGEGIADLFAIAANRVSKSARSLPWHCLELDRGSGPECYRNIAQPESSTLAPSSPDGTPGEPGLPPLYKDTVLGYHDYSDDPVTNCTDKTDFCGAHWNSTVISHWGYILGMGIASAANRCRLTVDALAPGDPDTSLSMALKIALIALSSRTALSSAGLTAEATFVDFRDATLQVTQELIGQAVLPADALAKVELAWAAVGLPPLASQSAVAAPANGSDVYPWTTFKWPLIGDGLNANAGALSWDFQLTNGTFEGTLPFHKDGLSTLDSTGTAVVLPLSLPYNSPSTFYWRVRPRIASDSSTDPWEICYPVHSFTGTSVPETAKNLHVEKELEAGTGKVMPGQFDLGWDFVHGTQSPDFDFWIGTTETACPPGDGSTPIAIAPVPTSDSLGQTGTVPFVSQPKTSYFAKLRPVGPPDFTGTPTHGECTGLAFETADLLPPETHAVLSPTTYREPWSQKFAWKTSGGAAKSLLTLYNQDANGNCSETPIGLPSVVEVPPDCKTSCEVTFTTPKMDGQPNLTGYCWDVVDVAANGAESPAAEKKHFDYQAFVTDEAPGNPWFFQGETMLSPAEESYGHDVTVSWTTLPNFPSAPAYALKIGRWFWQEKLAAPDPFNCHQVDDQGLNLCTLSPTSDEDPTILVEGASSKELPADVAGRGRYCYTIWPVFDPAHFGTSSGIEPKVETGLTCYTTGPALPTVDVPDGPGYVVDSTTVPDGAPKGPIMGEIHFDYVPNGQKQVLVSEGVTLGPDCTPEPKSVKYNDYYNCVIPFAIDAPIQGATYNIDVRTFNDTGYPFPIMDDTTEVHHVTKQITTGIDCGAKGETCCSNKTCTDSDAICDSTNTCAECGAKGKTCCANKACSDSDAICDSTTTCAECGKKGEACCANKACSDAVCNTSNKCADSVVKITSPAQGATVQPGSSLTVKWTDSNPPAKYYVTVSQLTGPDGGGGPGGPVNAAGNASQVTFSDAQLQFADKATYEVKVCPMLSNGSYGPCAQVSITSGPPPKDCSGTLAPPSGFFLPPTQVVSLCASVPDPGAKLNCMLNAPNINLCDLFPIHSQFLGIGWNAVPGATDYQMVQFGAFGTNVTNYQTTGPVMTSLTVMPALGDTESTCGFIGYGVSITAIDKVCNRTSSAFTGFAYSP